MRRRCVIKENIFDKETLKALKLCITGLTTKEITTEYSLDEETNQLKVVKQKVQEKNLPPNSDIIKLVYQHVVESKVDYNRLTDEELENEKQRLLKELKEKENACRKNQSKS